MEFLGKYSVLSKPSSAFCYLFQTKLKPNIALVLNKFFCETYLYVSSCLHHWWTYLKSILGIGSWGRYVLLLSIDMYLLCIIVPIYSNKLQLLLDTHYMIIFSIDVSHRIKIDTEASAKSSFLHFYPGFVHNNHKLYSAANNRLPTILEPPNPSCWLVDKLEHGWMCIGCQLRHFCIFLTQWFI